MLNIDNRITGTLYATGFGTMSYAYFSTLTCQDTYNVLMSETPIEYKLLILFSDTLAPFLFADGLSDIITGKHHYLVGKVWGLIRGKK